MGFIDEYHNTLSYNENVDILFSAHDQFLEASPKVHSN